MKSLIKFTLLIFALVIISCGQKRETVINNPEFDNTTVEYMILSKIELADTATIVHANVYNRPKNWIKIGSGGMLKNSKGKTYKLLDCKGFSLNEKVNMPESGTVAFQLYFEPVDKNEKLVDYVNIDNANEYISGIKLYTPKHTEAIHSILKGTVVNRPQSSRLMLLKSGADARTAKLSYIPILDGQFEYVLHTDDEEAYQLIFWEEHSRGSWRSIDFIAEQDTVNFTLYPMDESEKNAIEGGILNKKLKEFEKNERDFIAPLFRSFNDRMQSLQQEEKIYTTAATKLRQQIDALKYDDPERDELYDQMSKMHEEGTDLTPEAQAIYKESDSIGAVLLNRRLKFVKEDSGIAGYSILVELIRTEISEQKEDYLHRALEVYNDVYKTKYPDHPYVTVVESYVNASSVKVGNHYTDVAAIDSDGKEVKLSELINGKTALIHLWASWCGPCRQHGKEMIPIYEEYKDKGFIVVGIAREKGRNTMLNAVNQDKYPWVNLLEINDVHGIWAKFGVGNAGGADFLVDKNGNFLAVKTSPAVVKIILQNTFGN